MRNHSKREHIKGTSSDAKYDAALILMEHLYKKWDTSIHEKQHAFKHRVQKPTENINSFATELTCEAKMAYPKEGETERKLLVVTCKICTMANYLQNYKFKI